MSGTANEKWLEEISHKNIKIREPINDVDEVLRIARSFSMTQRVAKVPLIFRGQGNAANRLIPSAYRDLGRDKMGKFIGDKFSSQFDTLLRMRRIVDKGKSESDIEMEVLNEIQIDFEYRVFKEFICEGDRQAIPIPEFTTNVKSKLLNKHNEYLKKYWPPRQLYAALGLAQHYGVPTRFLDWTTDIFAALYFAAYGAFHNKDTDKAGNFILCLLHTGPYEEGISIADTARLMLLPINPPFEAIYVPTLHNANLAAQQGLFVYCRDVRFEKYGIAPTHDLVQVISSLKEIRINYPYLEAILVPVTEAAVLLGIMDSEGYSPSKYFPGLEGVVQTLKMRGEIR